MSLAAPNSGNNNAYAQDNAESWVDWASADSGLIEFTAAAIALRRTLAPLFDGRSLRGRPVEGAPIADVTWLAADGQAIDWNRDGRRHADRRIIRGRRAGRAHLPRPIGACGDCTPGFSSRIWLAASTRERGGTRRPDGRATIGDSIPGGDPRS